MILETTHTNKKNKKLINDLIGKPFSLIASFRLKGVRSKRMVIDEVSLNMKSYLNPSSDIYYGSIELRSNGILIIMNEGIKNFIWVIPFYQFYFYTSNGISIHAQGRFVHFKNNRTCKENAAFFDKLIRLKVDYDRRFPHVDLL